MCTIIIAIDTRWGDDINLSISVDSLQLLKRVNEKVIVALVDTGCISSSHQEIVTHELSSISFAAGGEAVSSSSSFKMPH